MSWVYELLDRSIDTERSALLAANVFVGLMFGFTLTIGLFDYLWMIVPSAAPTLQFFVAKIPEPFLII